MEKVLTKDKYKIPRQDMPHIPPDVRIKTFAEICQGFTQDTAQIEASRCILCKSKPCMLACPVQNDIPTFLDALMNGNMDEAVFRNSFPFSSICGRVCYHPCEQACVIGKKSLPVAICALERFAADAYDSRHSVEGQAVEVLFHKNDFSAAASRHLPTIAVAGSGPAGLMCAYELSRVGYSVTVIEKAPILGGMLTLGIPEYRLPRKIFKRVIDFLTCLGVRFVPNVAIGKTLTMQQLKDMGYSAIFLAFGAHLGKKMGVPGEELDGVVDAVSFLRDVNTGIKKPVGQRVAVIGGGDCAMDAARTVLRLGAGKVMIVYRRTVKEMPASVEEIEGAAEEGVEFIYLAAPTKVIGIDGKVSGLECLRMQLGEPDASGRRSPVPIQGSEFQLEVDMILPAISQEPQVDRLHLGGIEISKYKTVVADPATLQTSLSWVFAGGDLVSGPRTVTEAFAAGRKAAFSIHRYLSS